MHPVTHVPILLCTCTVYIHQNTLIYACIHTHPYGHLIEWTQARWQQKWDKSAGPLMHHQPWSGFVEGCTNNYPVFPTQLSTFMCMCMYSETSIIRTQLGPQLHGCMSCTIYRTYSQLWSHCIMEVSLFQRV